MKIKKFIYKILDKVEFYLYKLMTYYRFKRFGFKIIPCTHCSKGISEWEIELQGHYKIFVCEFCRSKNIYIDANRLESKWITDSELFK